MIIQACVGNGDIITIKISKNPRSHKAYILVREVAGYLFGERAVQAEEQHLQIS